MARKKKEKSIFGSIVGSGKKRGKQSGSIFTSITSGKGKKKKGDGSIFNSIMGGKKDKKKKGGMFSFSLGDSMGGGIFSIFGGSSPSRITADYDGMKGYLERHGMTTANRDAVLYYLMRFDGESDVKRILADLSSHGWGNAGRAQWAYQQWAKYQNDTVFREMVGHMGKDGQSPQTVKAFLQNYFSRSVPRGIYYYLQDVYEGSKSLGSLIPGDGEE